jgi:hypothetical protein
MKPTLIGAPVAAAGVDELDDGVDAGLEDELLDGAFVVGVEVDLLLELHAVTATPIAAAHATERSFRLGITYPHSLSGHPPYGSGGKTTYRPDDPAGL